MPESRFRANFFNEEKIVCQKTWFFKGILGASLVCGLLLLSGCDLLGIGGDEEEETTYAVSYSPGEGSGATPGTQTVKAGEVIILPNQGGMTAPEGKTFGGWKTEDKTYQAGAGFTVNRNTVFTAAWNSGAGGDSVYTGFYNYPTGRVNPNGLLTISNSIAKQTLLFNGTVEAANYIGTINSLSSLKVKLPEEKFYTIVAVDKENYEERQTQAAQFNVLAYYSDTQPYSITVSPSNTYGGGVWKFNNKTSFWVQIKKADLSQNYAVIAPNAEQVSIPIALNTPYDYFVYFSKELRYNGKTVALVETTDRSQANTAQVNNNNTVYTTTIMPANVPTNNVKPAVMVKNNSNKSVRVYYANNQKTNGAANGDFVVTGGASQLVSGFEINDNANVIEFSALAWESNKKVPVNMVMKANKVYEITIPNNESASDITVTEVEASNYYN
jgi:hypothetical protein